MMKTDIRELPRDSFEQHVAAQLGFAVELMLDCPRKSFKIASLAPWLMPPIRLRQIEFLFNANHHPLAYATWAFLTDEVAAEYRDNDRRLLHLGEWNEGCNLWVIDVVAPFGHARALLANLQRRLGGFERVQALRRQPDGTIRRLVSRARAHAAQIPLSVDRLPPVAIAS